MAVKKELPAQATRGAWNVIRCWPSNNSENKTAVLIIQVGILAGRFHGWQITVRRGDDIYVSRHIMAMRSSAERAAARLASELARGAAP